MLVELLGLLTHKDVLHFFDAFYKSPTDPGRYVSVYMTEGTPVYYYGNHGWSSEYKHMTCEEMAGLIAKNWDESDGRSYGNYIEIKPNLWSERDKDLYYKALSKD
ncbi:MAG: hypothetical protein K6F49_10510 [Saccharofermentans sp.]|nr:hypothetical protein [Saccharofermentans sp.]